MNSRRQSRVAELLQRELAQMITYELRDPRLASVTVTRVEVTPDLRLARVYISTLGDEGAGREAVAGLEHASGYLRRELGRRTDLRFLPELRFVYDTSVEYSQHMNTLLDQLMAAPAAASAEESAPAAISDGAAGEPPQ